MQAPARDPITGQPAIPAMTTDAERECYYRLASEAARQGAIIEFGAWLGASTAYIAAAIRDSGEPARAHIYDKFETRRGHIRKVRSFYAKRGQPRGDMPLGDAFAQFKRNLGPLVEFIEPHKCEIATAKWEGGPIALIVNDAPKRVPAISAMLTNFRPGIRPGTIMAWQDFGHFPSYEIPACLYRLREHFEFIEAVTPGTTLVFRVKSVWDEAEVSPEALALASWTPAEIDAAWQYWLDWPVPAEKSVLFRCGEAMFLCDTGHTALAVAVLESAFADDADAILGKWLYLRGTRPDFFIRYRPLFDCVPERKALAA